MLVTEWSDTATSCVDDALDGLVDRRVGESLTDRLVRAVGTSGSYVMVILDQFEELLRDVGRGDSAPFDLLVDTIVSLVTAGRGVSFVVAIRADVLADLDRLLNRLGVGFVPQAYRIDPMTPGNAEEAIRQPIREYNKEFHASISVDKQLVRNVVYGDARGEDDVVARLTLGLMPEEVDLPFLQIVMMRLWAAERLEVDPPSDHLRASTLQRLGGIEKVVAGHVSGILDGLTNADRRTATAVLQWLITPTGGKVAYSAEDLARLTELAVADVERVVTQLSAQGSRLLRPAERSSGPTRYELFHDRLAGPVANWREREEEDRRVTYRNRVVAVASIVVVIAIATIGLIAWWIAADADQSPPFVETMTIVGAGTEDLDASLLYDGDERDALIIPLGPTRLFKIEVLFTEVVDLVDFQVVPGVDEAAPPPAGAYIPETRIEVPIGNQRHIGDGAFGRADSVTIIIEGWEFDTSVRIAELKFWLQLQ